MHFGITNEHTNVVFPARLTFGPWFDALRTSLHRATEAHSKSKTLIACTPSQLSRARAAIAASEIESILCEEYRTCDPDSVRHLDANCATNSIDILVAFGAGNVIDLCKLVARRRNCLLIVIPSALSSDCIASPVAVLRDEHQSVSRPGAMPSEIILDTKVVASAPTRLLLAGIGDLLSNACALLELEERSQFGHEINDFSVLLSEASLRGFVPLISGAQKASIPEEVIEALAKSLILSAMAMAFAGNSSPCSGSEHLISHALDAAGNGGLHGEQVGLATIYVSALREILGKEAVPKDIVRALRKYCGYTCPERFNISRTSFLRAVVNADKVRPGRTPFWAKASISQRELEVAYDAAFHGSSAATSRSEGLLISV